MSYYEEIVSEYLQAGGQFIRREYFISLDKTLQPAKGRSWYVDVLAVDFSGQTIWLLRGQLLQDALRPPVALQAMVRQLGAPTAGASLRDSGWLGLENTCTGVHPGALEVGVRCGAAEDRAAGVRPEVERARRYSPLALTGGLDAPSSCTRRGGGRRSRRDARANPPSRVGVSSCRERMVWPHLYAERHGLPLDMPLLIV